MMPASLNLRYLTFDFVGFFSVVEEGIGCSCWKEILRRKRGYVLRGEGQERVRGEGITGPDPAVQVLIFRDVVRAEGLLCASCFY